MVPETNFPDIRNVAIIHSTDGSCTIIPREGELVRFYTQLSDANVVGLTGRVDKSKMTPQNLLSVSISREAASYVVQLMSACRSRGRYSIRLSWETRKRSNGGQFTSVCCFQVWHSRPCQRASYPLVGQRVASSYTAKDRVFIAGDACHTHSPQAGEKISFPFGIWNHFSMI